MSSSKIVQALISAPLGNALKAHGFTRKALVFRRLVGDAKQVLRVQCSTGATRDKAKLVFNVGVLLPAVDRLLRRPRVVEPTEAECTVRDRIGPKRAANAWWSLNASAAAPPKDLLVRVEEAVIPWFAMATDLGALNEALDKDGDIWSDDRLIGMGVALAVGDRPLAESRLNEAVAKIQAQRQERAAQFPKDPFGTEVLRRAKKLSQEHGLTLEE